LEATVRSFSRETYERVRVAASQLLRGIAAAHGVEVTVDYVDQYPPTINDVAETAFAAETVVALFGEDRHVSLPTPFAGSEDFSRVLERVPGSFVGLGATPPGLDPGTAPFNHSPHAQFDDAVLPDGAALYAELALRRLALSSATSNDTGHQHERAS
jgi:hippurate hydrolase